MWYLGAQITHEESHMILADKKELYTYSMRLLSSSATLVVTSSLSEVSFPNL
jgi:hypothetical protein